MVKPKVLLLGTIDSPVAQKQYRELSALADLIEPKSTSRAGFMAEARSGAFDGVLAIYRTFSSVDITGRVDEELVEVLPSSLKFICHNGAGYDQISIPACTARNIHVSHTPHVVDDTTADTAVFLILGCLRNFQPSLASIRANAWRGNPAPRLGHDPAGKILGILGLGGIGRNLARKMRAFGMEIWYHNRKKLAPGLEEGAKYVGFEDLLRGSDVLSLSLPLNPATHHLLSTPQLALLKPSAILINTARGAIVDEAALARALAAGALAGAGLDVFEREPAVHAALLASERVLLLPHMGTWTEEAQEAMECKVVENVRAAVERGELVTRVGEQAGMEYGRRGAGGGEDGNGGVGGGVVKGEMVAGAREGAELGVFPAENGEAVAAR